MISIGEFSRICHVTTRTLRHYDEIGLLKPTYTNDENNYRFYDVSQIRKMLLINRLKRYSFSLCEIKEMIYDKNLDYIMDKLSDKKIEIQKKMIEFNPDENDTEVAIPVKENKEETRIFKGCLCAMIEFKGSYSKLSDAYGKLTEWIDENNYEVNGAPYEKYITGPMDGKEIVTEIYFPVKKISK